MSLCSSKGNVSFNTKLKNNDLRLTLQRHFLLNRLTLLIKKTTKKRIHKSKNKIKLYHCICCVHFWKSVRVQGVYFM